MDIDYTVWQEFGLAGMVIGSLFGGVYFIIRWIFGFVSKMAEQHTSERSEWKDFADKQLCEHREERKEWQAEFKEIRESNKEGLDRVCDVLSNRIRDLALHDIGEDKKE